MDNESMLLCEPSHQSARNVQARQDLADYWQESPGTSEAKLQSFPKYVSREDITKFVARNEVISLKADRTSGL
jgi:hypothetical protein